MKRSMFCLIGLVLLFGGAGQARAEFIVTFSQQGNNVVATGSGSLNLTALRFAGEVTLLPGVTPSLGTTGVGPISQVDLYSVPSSPPTFGTGGAILANSGTGSTVGNINISNELFINVPVGYLSGSSLSGSSTYDNTTISTLGMTPGTYTWTWGSAANGTADDLKIVIPSASHPSAAPEPASLTMLGIGALGLLGYGWRRRK
jgi:PEP-CTERM motif